MLQGVPESFLSRGSVSQLLPRPPVLHHCLLLVDRDQGVEETRGWHPGQQGREEHPEVKNTHSAHARHGSVVLHLLVAAAVFSHPS